MQRIDEIHHLFQQDLAQAQSTADIEALKVKYLGRKGPIQQAMQGLKEASPEERPLLGKQINDVKEAISKHCEEALQAFYEKELGGRLVHEALDVTLPGRRRYRGGKHLITHMLDTILNALTEIGFSVQYGPDIESDYYNFEALNFAADHPARDLQDTFFIADDILLRTHTSNVQVRIMEMTKPPIRIAAPGRVYRNEAVTSRSHVFFHQVEAFYIDKDVSFTHLLGTLETFLHAIFGKETAIRYRPSYFPFVEPGMEVDIRCSLCAGKGCGMCKQSGWLEVLGAGMVHPEVLKNGGIDPEEYSGFAWGLGVERFANIKYGVSDIRLFTENNLRFLQQFPVS